MSEHQNNQKKAENNSSLSQLSQERATKSNAIEIPPISLPKGGGAIKGIDEKFQVNAANGTLRLVFHFLFRLIAMVLHHNYRFPTTQVSAMACLALVGILIYLLFNAEQIRNCLVILIQT
jgi:hypothetical protein